MTTLLGAGMERSAWAACWSSSCHGKDPVTEGCSGGAFDGATASVWGVLTVKVRKSTNCGGVKWGWASRDTFYTGGTFSVWLEDNLGNRLPGTTYTELNNGVIQIYGDMYTGAVRACTLVSPYSPNKVCTGLDP